MENTIESSEYAAENVVATVPAKAKKVKTVRKLPSYTKGEEIFNTVTHIVGAVFGIAVLITCVAISSYNQNLPGLIGSIIFGMSSIILYTMSSVYHGARTERIKRVLQVLDHCTIYLLIAGTYTPILLSSIRLVSPAACYTLLGIEWGIVAVCTVFTAIDVKKYRALSMVGYIGLGWGIMAVAPIAVKALTMSGFALLLVGGIFYTVGSVLYGVGKRKKYMHSVFHIFCLLGTVFHFICIIMYVL